MLEQQLAEGRRLSAELVLAKDALAAAKEAVVSAKEAEAAEAARERDAAAKEREVAEAAVAKLTAQLDEAQVEVKRVIAQRDAAQAEVTKVIEERDRDREVAKDNEENSPANTLAHSMVEGASAPTIRSE